jgi:hypothetical protein
LAETFSFETDAIHRTCVGALLVYRYFFLLLLRSQSNRTVGAFPAGLAKTRTVLADAMLRAAIGTLLSNRAVPSGEAGFAKAFTIEVAYSISPAVVTALRCCLNAAVFPFPPGIAPALAHKALAMSRASVSAELFAENYFTAVRTSVPRLA